MASEETDRAMLEAAGFTAVKVFRQIDADVCIGSTIDEAIARGFLPAAPRKDGCRWCDYRLVCGPYEESRVKNRKRRAELEPLFDLRGMP